MDFLQAFVVGTVQGITEWLPISSEGINSILLTQIYGTTLAEAILISIWLHIGTLFAALIYLRKDVIHVLKTRDQTFWFLVVATIASLIVAAPLMLITTDFFLLAGKNAMILIGILLIITGLMQWKAKKQKSENKKITYKDAIIAGIAQGLAILPGLSRSGLTISVLLFRRYHPTQSIKLSFLMSIPAIIIAGAWASTKTAATFSSEGLAALAASFIFGLITIAALLKLAERINFSYFCFLIGVIAIIAGLV
ncbi:MAG: undecaprenyl-diphosphate phosphatase [Candidatus Aenigmatarchaeota archaeon]|nr:undecaprenyl-diphosphate phosphatase [Nanoarchaeota archaeon]